MSAGRYLSHRQRQEYADKGFIVARRVFQASDFDHFTDAFLCLVEKLCERRFSALQDPALREFFDENRQVESEIYNAVRAIMPIQRQATDARFACLLEELFPERRFGVLEKMILRIDLPGWEAEVAHWHQDYFYVRGNTETVTAWVPLQAVNPRNGCLLVEPGSHVLGVVEHSHRVGKRCCPEPSRIAAFSPVEVEMDVGDVLLFHALLFHSGQLNRSDAIRYSLQFRYSPLGLSTDPGMGRLIPFVDRQENTDESVQS